MLSTKTATFCSPTRNPCRGGGAPVASAPDDRPGACPAQRDRAQHATHRSAPRASQPPAPCTAPQPMGTPTLSPSANSCNTVLPACGVVRALTRGVPIVLRTVLCTLSQELSHVNNGRKRNICPRVSACVLACFRVHNRSPDGQELSSVTPSSRVRSHRRRRMTNSTASETSAALHRPVAYILVLGLPCGWRPGTGTNATPMRAGAHVGPKCSCLCFPVAMHTPCCCPHQSRDDGYDV